MQVHDELVLEVPDGELSLVREKLPEMMCGVAKLKVPLVAEVGAGANWEEHTDAPLRGSRFLRHIVAGMLNIEMVCLWSTRKLPDNACH